MISLDCEWEEECSCQMGWIDIGYCQMGQKVSIIKAGGKRDKFRNDTRIKAFSKLYKHALKPAGKSCIYLPSLLPSLPFFLKFSTSWKLIYLGFS